MAGTVCAWNQAISTQQAIYRLQTREGDTTGAGLLLGPNRALICTRNIAKIAPVDTVITKHRILGHPFPVSGKPEAYKIGWPSGRLRKQDTREQMSFPRR
ncbi:MAG: hypothetical protein QNJ45_28000 [Ardenticatenaceae bacterium]|nr:hypothetical protein [Ardenticatenaceae bacterium]